MSGGTRTTGKPRALALALVVLAVSAGTLQGSTPSATAAPLDAGSDFTISSTVSQSSAAPDRPALLQPGVTRYLWYSVTNQLRTAITVTAVGLSDVAAPAACPVSNLELGDPTFTGSFVVSAGSTRTIPAPMPISLIDLPDVNQDACKDVAFAFTFTGTAHYSDLPESDIPESDLPESDSAESDLPESDRSDSDVSQSGDATRLGRPKLGRRTRLGRLDPLALLGAAILVSGAALVSTSVPLNLGLAALALGAALVGGLPSGRIGLLGTPALLATLSVAVSNALLSPTGLMSRDAWQAAALPASRVLAVALPGLVAAVAVDPTALADALVARLRVPARAAYSTLAALRLLPLLADEWATLGRASRARGTGGSGLRARSAQFLSMTFRLLVAALRRGGRLAIALDARGLRAGAPRTLARPLSWRWSDSAALSVGALAAIVAATLRW